MRASLQLAPWIVLLTAACSSGPAVSHVQPGAPPLTGDAEDGSTSKKSSSSSDEDAQSSDSAQTTQPAESGSTCTSDCRAASPKAAATLVQQWSACLGKCTTASCKSACEDEYRTTCDDTSGCNDLLECLAACK